MTYLPDVLASPDDVEVAFVALSAGQVDRGVLADAAGAGLLGSAGR